MRYINLRFTYFYLLSRTRSRQTTQYACCVIFVITTPSYGRVTTSVTWRFDSA